MARMVFEIATLGYIQRNQSIVMDYEIEIRCIFHSQRIVPLILHFPVFQNTYFCGNHSIDSVDDNNHGSNRGIVSGE